MANAGINVVRPYEPLTDVAALDQLWNHSIYVISSVGWLLAPKLLVWVASGRLYGKDGSTLRLSRTYSLSQA